MGQVRKAGFQEFRPLLKFAPSRPPGEGRGPTVPRGKPHTANVYLSPALYEVPPTHTLAEHGLQEKRGPKGEQGPLTSCPPRSCHHRYTHPSSPLSTATGNQPQRKSHSLRPGTQARQTKPLKAAATYRQDLGVWLR